MTSVKLPPDMDSTPCLCGHPRWTHEHYRRGTDCGTCGRRVCPWFQAPRPLGWWARTVAAVRSWLS
jgi:hypothetical protein